MIPNGDAAEREQDIIRNHPLLKGVPNVPTNNGRPGWSVMTVTPTLLLATGMTSDNKWNLFAIDKKTGKRLGTVEIPGPTLYGLSSWTHQGRQYVVVQLVDGLAAMALKGTGPPPSGIKRAEID
jgi:quinoprotein glucose dehydrogenase